MKRILQNNNFFRCLSIGGILVTIVQAHAVTDITYGDLSNLTEAAVRNLLRPIAYATDHRAYMPAHMLGTKHGPDIGYELTTLLVPTMFITGLEKAGTEVSGQLIFFNKANFHLGVFDFLDLGFSLGAFGGGSSWGLETKFLFYGDYKSMWNSAARLTWSQTNVWFMQTRTISLDGLLSRRMVIPYLVGYLGLGIQIGSGNLVVDTITLSRSIDTAASFWDFRTLFGLQGQVYVFRMTTEVSINLVGVTTVGLKLSVGL